MIGDTYFRADIGAEEVCLVVNIKEFKCVHSSDCYDFVIPATEVFRFESMKHHLPKRGLIKLCKALHIKLRRVDKMRSRIAFKTADEAISNLCYRKQLQLAHLERETKFLKKFLQHVNPDGTTCNLQHDICGDLVVPNSKSIVNKYLRFH